MLERTLGRSAARARVVVLAVCTFGLLTAALALEHTHHEQQAGAAGPTERSQLAGFVWGALVGAVIVLLFSYLSWRRQELQLEQIAAERERMLAFEQRRLLLKEVRHPFIDHSSGSANASGHSSMVGASGEAPATQQPSPSADARPVNSPTSPPANKGPASVESGGTHSSAHTPRRKTELKMIEEFLCTLVGRGSDRGSKGSRSSTVGSANSSGPLSMRLGLSPSQSPLTRSGHIVMASSGNTSNGLTRTDLEKLPPGFADISPADISLVKELGEGSYGEVWLASYCQTLVAVKIASRTRHANLTATLQQQATLRNLRNEASLMATLNHPNICRYLGACLDPPLMVMEYCAKKSLDALLADGLVNPATRKELTWDRLLGMVLDAANGMKFLHTRQPAAVAHRDLKSANLLVDANWHVKVSDFGLSRAVDASKAASTVLVTNPRWLAPCVLSGLPGQLAADVWAFGTVMWECATWQLPFENMNPYQIIALVREQGTDSLQLPPPDQLEAGPFAAAGNYEAYHQLMRDCRASDPNQRPGFVEIVSRLSTIVERENHARHPEVELARRSPSSSAEMLKTFRLPPDGPAHKHAIAALQRRRSGLIQGHSGDIGAGADVRVGSAVGSAPSPGAPGSTLASKSAGGTAGSAPAVLASGSSPAVAAGDSSPQAATVSTMPAKVGHKLAGKAYEAAPVAALLVSNVGAGAADGPTSPMPTDEAPLDISRS